MGRRRRLSRVFIVGSIGAAAASILILCSHPSPLIMIEAFSPLPPPTSTSALHPGRQYWQNDHHRHHPQHGQIITSASPLSRNNNNNYNNKIMGTIYSPNGRRRSSSMSLSMAVGVVGGGILAHGINTFTSNWKAYSLIPLIAGFVGWFTNYLAVQMIFYPIKWRGIPIYKVEGEPLGLLGWQGEFLTSLWVSLFAYLLHIAWCVSEIIYSHSSFYSYRDHSCQNTQNVRGHGKHHHQ